MSSLIPRSQRSENEVAAALPLAGAANNAPARVEDGLGAERVARLSASQLLLAFLVAAVGDLLSFLLTMFEPAVIIVDIGTGILLSVILGLNRVPLLLLPVLPEAVSGISAFPFWVMDVALIATLDSRGK